MLGSGYSSVNKIRQENRRRKRNPNINQKSSRKPVESKTRKKTSKHKYVKDFSIHSISWLIRYRKKSQEVDHDGKSQTCKKNKQGQKIAKSFIEKKTSNFIPFFQIYLLNSKQFFFIFYIYFFNYKICFDNFSFKILQWI